MLKKSLAGVMVAAATCGLIAFAGTAANAATPLLQPKTQPAVAQLADVNPLCKTLYDLQHDGHADLLALGIQDGLGIGLPNAPELCAAGGAS